MTSTVLHRQRPWRHRQRVSGAGSSGVLAVTDFHAVVADSSFPSSFAVAVRAVAHVGVVVAADGVATGAGAAVNVAVIEIHVTLAVGVAVGVAVDVAVDFAAVEIHVGVVVADVAESHLAVAVRDSRNAVAAGVHVGFEAAAEVAVLDATVVPEVEADPVGAAQRGVVAVAYTFPVHVGWSAGTLATRARGVAWGLEGAHSAAEGRWSVVPGSECVADAPADPVPEAVPWPGSASLPRVDSGAPAARASCWCRGCCSRSETLEHRTVVLQTKAALKQVKY